MEPCWKSAAPRDAACAVVLALLASALAPGCGGGSGAGTGTPASLIAASRVQSQLDPERPTLTLVERDGDPQRGLALAVRVGEPLAAIAISDLVEGRLRAMGVGSAGSHASPRGFIVSALATDSEQLGSFIRAANRALLAPISAAEASRVAAHLRASPPRFASSASEAALAECSGELLLPASESGTLTLAASLPGWLADVSVGDVAFAVVGPREQLEVAAGAVAALPAWQRRGGAPSSDLDGVTVGRVSGPAGALSLSVALWGVDPSAAVASAEQLAEPDSLLAVRLAAAFPEWQVVRVSSNLDRDGACLRADLHATGGPAAVEAIALSARGALAELEHSIERLESVPWVLAKQVLAMEAPHQAAAVAAWQALNGGSSAARRARRIVHFSGEIAPPASGAQLVPMLEASPPSPSPSPVESKGAVEAGQGKFWMLVATPCGTTGEDATTAGTLALALHATALAFNGRSGVSLEPWLTVDSMGLLAQSPAISPRESPAAQAERVAEVLARAVLSNGPPPEVISQAREALLSGLAAAPTPTLTLALKQTSANHPSWLDPRGTWSSLSAISARAAQLERESFLRGKLRLATLANVDEAQLRVGEQRLLDLLSSADAGRGECPARAVPAPVPGRYRIDIAGRADADAIISIPLPSAEAGVPAEALFTELLMNRSDGWLQQALTRPGLVSTARARVVGGASLAALVIELHALDGRREEAVAQIRGLLERLRGGAASVSDLRAASELFERREAQRGLNPRARVVDLWHGRARQRATLDSLRALHRVAFEAGREVVVLAETTDAP